MLIDYHVHTTISGDSQQTIDSICEDAKNLGINEICLTEHCDFYPESFYYNRFNYDKICEVIDYANKKYPDLIIKKGIEIDYQTQYLLELFDIVAKYDLDYILGSVHKLNGIDVSCPECYENHSMDEIYTIYFQKIREMIGTNMFNCVAHFDFIKRGAIDYFGPFDPNRYKTEICDTLKEIIKRDMSIEVNTNGYYWKTLNTYYPNIQILKWYKELGGENITYGSDSHRVHHLGTKINEMYDLIKSLGFTRLTTYTKKVKKYINI